MRSLLFSLFAISIFCSCSDDVSEFIGHDDNQFSFVLEGEDYTFNGAEILTQIDKSQGKEKLRVRLERGLESFYFGALLNLDTGSYMMDRTEVGSFDMFGPEIDFSFVSSMPGNIDVIKNDKEAREFEATFSGLGLGSNNSTKDTVEIIQGFFSVKY